ncbi:DUF3131 domain-containing protein [Rhodalgimonas zhirmunskyi]|uniref:DUF3131 domain-containing protein n=1 Tax=Rhodalgimonas zhirmunskyi TaxID=2964767 RepID=A0AAJ1U3D7_9RHOB|nr:DUF3131 domain-containing protein [Rhodoalgimonas zhirmunskyi]MDQ2092986.1 DUF3131 domain-containing protein [Rhodoalgimonas zhirmunskyi]
MKRRSFLTSTTAAALLTAFGNSRGRAAGGIVSVAVVITDITADTEQALLVQVVSGLLEKGVLVTCAVELPQDQSFDPALGAVIADLVSIGGGIEFALHVPDLASISPYFQSRAVYEAKLRFRKITEGVGTPLDVQTIVCEEVDAPVEPIGVRAAGVKNVLMRPGADRHVTSQAWSENVVRYFGGNRITTEDGFILRSDAAGPEDRMICYVSAGHLVAMPEGRLAVWTQEVAQTLTRMEMSGQIALMTVPDMQLRDNFKQERLVTLLIETPENASESDLAIVKAFRTRLSDAGIPSATKNPGEDFWVTPTKSGGELVATRVLCQNDRSVQIAASSSLEPGYGLRFVSDKADTSGIDGCAQLRLQVSKNELLTHRTEGAMLRTGSSDSVIVLSVAEISTPASRRHVLSSLLSMREDAITRIVGIGDFARRLHTHGPVETRHRLTRALSANHARSRAQHIDEAERARLLDDAKLAWRYFQSHTNGVTGLCPATVDGRPGGEIHEAVTMWDVGSNINAIAAAAEIGLIDREQAKSRLKAILPNISGRRTQGRLLPQGWIRTDRFHWGDWNFDGCDAGRLLAAFDYFRRRIGMEKELEKRVAAWEFEKVIVDRKLHSVADGELVSTYRTHCAHYLAIAFRRWGYDIASPYEIFRDRNPGDGEMALLETVASIGPLGAEPLLLEALELGMSPESEYLADVLQYAQEEEHEETGRLICASETPIDRAPWFIYQGLQLGAGPRSWRLDTVGHQPQYMTRDAAEEYMAFSTKAAFLWAMLRPGQYSDRLLSHARKMARESIGFASSINLKSQRPTSRYSDLNTNAIILQSIAYRLSKPH